MSKKAIFKNFTALTVLQVVQLLMSLLTYPYLIRTLGQSQYGVIAYSQAIIGYLSLIVNFGFAATATKDIALCRDDSQAYQQIASSVFACKALLLVASLLIYGVVISLVPWLRAYQTVYWIAGIGLLGNWLFPDWFFQGIEKMQYITYASILARIAGVLAIFLWVKQPSDMVIVAWIYSVSNLLMGVIGFYFFCQVIPFKRLFKVDGSAVKQQFIDGFAYFFSNVVANAKEYMSVFVMGAWFNYQTVAVYDMARKVVSVLVMPLSSLARAVFPMTVKQKSQNFNQKIERLLLVGALGLSVVTWLLPDKVWHWLMAGELGQFKIALYALLWTLPMYALTLSKGYLGLIANHQNKIFSKNIVFSVGVYFFLLGGLKALNFLTIQAACITIVISLACEALLHYCSLKQVATVVKTIKK